MPALEWEETAIKFEPMLDALRTGGARFPDRTGSIGPGALSVGDA